MSNTIERLYKSGKKVEAPRFMPEPEPRERKHLVVSVDDHVVEPPHLFEGRVPQKYVERAPRIVETDDGDELWTYEGETIANIGLNASVGRHPTDFTAEPTRFEQMRKGAWDISARLADMDLNGIYASLNFPSMLPGFAGQRFSALADQEFGFALMRAWNDWHLEEWAGAQPGRIIPNQITWLADPERAADEVRRNAERGFRALTFPENPERLGLPSLHTDHWDPLMRACEETETPVCLHVGSSSFVHTSSDLAPPDAAAVLFPISAWFAAVDWIYSKIPLRFPDLRIALSEGGVGWVPALKDKLRQSFKYHEWFGTWMGESLDPADVLSRNFWFCALEEDNGLRLIDVVGEDHVMVESDYPHADGTWPDSQVVIDRIVEGLSPETVAKVTHANALALFHHPWPSEVGLGDEFPVPSRSVG